MRKRLCEYTDGKLERVRQVRDGAWKPEKKLAYAELKQRRTRGRMSSSRVGVSLLADARRETRPRSSMPDPIGLTARRLVDLDRNLLAVVTDGDGYTSLTEVPTP